MSLVVALIIVLALPGLATSADVIKLTYASLYGSDHTMSRADKLWIEKIQKETNGRVQITPYWGGTLFPLADAIDEMVIGTADIGVVSPVRARMGFEITKAAPYFFHGCESAERWPYCQGMEGKVSGSGKGVQRLEGARLGRGTYLSINFPGAYT